MNLSKKVNWNISWLQSLQKRPWIRKLKPLRASKSKACQSGSLQSLRCYKLALVGVLEESTALETTHQLWIQSICSHWRTTIRSSFSIWVDCLPSKHIRWLSLLTSYPQLQETLHLWRAKSWSNTAVKSSKVEGKALAYLTLSFLRHKQMLIKSTLLAQRLPSHSVEIWDMFQVTPPLKTPNEG